MISPILTDIPQQDINIFECISIPTEIYVPTKEVPIIDYWVTEYPRNNNNNPFPFVYGLFDKKEVAFSNSQDIVLNIANELFSNSYPLNEFEQNVLNETFKKSIIYKPTLSGRK
jgi:hypothetical protein